MPRCSSAGPSKGDRMALPLTACLSRSTAVEIEPKGRSYSWERVWLPHIGLEKSQGPYLVILVELPHAGMSG